MIHISKNVCHLDGVFPTPTVLPPLFQVPCVFASKTGFITCPLTLQEQLSVWDVPPTFSNALSVSAQRSLMLCLRVPWKLLAGVVSICDAWLEGTGGGG